MEYVELGQSDRPFRLFYMNQETSTIQYLIYARKSSESDDRQVQSIDDQINRLKQLAYDLKLHVKEVYTEAKSAKKPNNRPVFDEVMRRIEKGEAEGILCWQINRLSRNPIDSGRISWLLQQGVLKSIQTIDRQYLPDDNVLLFSVESGSANQFIIDLKKNVKRGMESKVLKGWAPSIAPLGYLNDKLEKIIIKDPERFNLIRKMWDLMLTGSYTPPKILDIATHEWGLRTRTKKKNKYGSNLMSMSSIYRLFSNPFYAGMIRRSNMYYPGNHEAMITVDEYDSVQNILGKEGRPRPQCREFAFTGILRCGECNCMFTAEVKKKLLKNGQIKEYTYYHCTRKTRKVKCTQKRAITKEALEVLIEEEIEKYTIIPDFLPWTLEELNRRNDAEIETRTNIYETQHTALAQTQKELDQLTKMRYRELIDDEVFINERTELLKTITRLKLQLHETESRAERWLELTEDTFTFVTYAQDAFSKGGLELKKEILLGLGETLLIKDGKLIITPHEWLVPIKNWYHSLEQEFRGLELNKTPMNATQNDVIATILPKWQSLVEDVRTIFEKLNDASIHIPKLIISQK